MRSRHFRIAWTLALSVMLVLTARLQSQERNLVDPALVAFAAGNFEVAERSLRGSLTDAAEIERLARQLRRRLGDLPRRTEAAFALEAAGVAYEVDAVPLDHQASGRRLGLESAVTLVEFGMQRLNRGCDTFTRQWYVAALAMLDGPMPQPPARPFSSISDSFRHWRLFQHPDLPAGSRFGTGSGRPGFSQVMERATRECPHDPAFWFANGLWNERLYFGFTKTIGSIAKHGALPGHSPVDATPSAARASQAFSRVLKSSVTDLHGLAALHLGQVLWAGGSNREAMAALAEVPRLSTDRDLRYLAELFRGMALWTDERLPDAALSFEAALMLRPKTSSAQVPLAAVLALTGRRQEASRLAHEILDGELEDADPWWSYFQPFYPGWPDERGRLRAMVKPQ